MKKNITFFTLLLAFVSYAQSTITFKGCTNLFEDQVFTFTKTGTDAYGKGIYITIPVDGDQPCGGVGVCEFKILWNNMQNRWEFLADKGNGDFIDPYLIYYNSTSSNTATNPPNNVIGTWVEYTTLTAGQCGGNLTAANSTLTGDVQTTTLGVENFKSSKVVLYPNPVVDFLNISGISNAERLEIYSTTGNLVFSERYSETVNVSKLTSGIYILKIISKEFKTYELKFIKK